MSFSRLSFCGMTALLFSSISFASPWNSKDPVDPAYMAQALSCVKSVCGDAKDNLGAIDITPSRLAAPASNYLKMWDEKFEASMRKLVEERKKTAALAEERMKAWAEKSYSLDTTQPDFALHNLRYVTAPVDRLESYIGINKDGVVEVHPSLLSVVLTPLTPEIKAVVELFLSKVLMPNAELRKFEKMNSKALWLQGRMSLRFPQASYEKALALDAVKLQQQIADMSKVLGKSYAGVVFPAQFENLLNKAQQGQALSAKEILLYPEMAKKIELNAAALLDADINRALLAVPNQLGSIAAQFKEKNMSQFYSTKWNQANPELIDKISMRCRKNLHESLEFSTSDFRIRRGQLIFEDVRKVAITVAASLANPVEAQELTAKLTSLRLETPEKTSERAKRVEDSLSKDMDSSSRMMNLLNDKDEKAQRAFAILLLAGGLSDSFAGPLAVDSTCLDLPREVLTDYAAVQDNLLSISWYSFNYPQIGVGVMAHEIGHIVSGALKITSVVNPNKNPVFSQARACVDTRNPYQKVASGRSSVFLEEDFADYFSSLVLNELQKQNSPWAATKNMACAMKLDMGDKYEIDFRPYLLDPHSTAFLRLLMIETDRRTVTPECQPFINELQENANLQCVK